MKRPRIRIGTLMLLIVVVGLVAKLAAQHRDIERQASALQAEVNRMRGLLDRKNSIHIDRADPAMVRKYREDWNSP